VTERFAYAAFLTVVGVGLATMTVTLAVIWIALARQTRKDRRQRAAPPEPANTRRFRRP